MDDFVAKLEKGGKPGKHGPGIITSTRLSESERAALDKAAADDTRPTASLMKKILVDWLKERGYLK